MGYALLAILLITASAFGFSKVFKGLFDFNRLEVDPETPKEVKKSVSFKYNPLCRCLPEDNECRNQSYTEYLHDLCLSRKHLKPFRDVLDWLITQEELMKMDYERANSLLHDFSKVKEFQNFDDEVVIPQLQACINEYVKNRERAILAADGFNKCESETVNQQYLELLNDIASDNSKILEAIEDFNANLARVVGKLKADDTDLNVTNILRVKRLQKTTDAFKRAVEAAEAEEQKQLDCSAVPDVPVLQVYQTANNP